MIKNTLFIAVFLFLSIEVYAQLEKGKISIDNSFGYVAIQPPDIYRSFYPSIHYTINNAWTVGINPSFGYDVFGENKSKDRGLSTTVRFIVTPKSKRKLYLQEGFRFTNGSLESTDPFIIIDNSANINLGIGMYRFINPNVAFHHNLNWSYGFYARRRNDKPWGNEFYKHKIEYKLNLQNFSNFSKRDTIRDEPFEAGRIMTDFNIRYTSASNGFRYALSGSGFYGLFVADNFLIGTGASLSGYGFNISPMIRYYAPITLNIAVFGGVDVSMGRNFLAEKANSLLYPNLGIHYLFNENVGAEVSLFYEKDLLSKLSEEKYYGIQSGIRYYFK